MYQWLAFLHVLGVFGFLLAHGASASVGFALRPERNLERVRAFLTLSANSYPVMYLSLLVLLVTGIITGVMGDWWGRGWIWASLSVLILLIAWMFVRGGGYYSVLRKAVGLPYMMQGKLHPAETPVGEAEMITMLNSSRPLEVAVIGVIGLGVLLWLMMFKPF